MNDRDESKVTGIKSVDVASVPAADRGRIGTPTPQSLLGIDSRPL
jgi:hypothetical protein